MSENKGGSEIPLVSNRAVVDFLIWHIDHPCKFDLPGGKTADMREFHLKEAKGFLPRIKDLKAKALLEKKINEFSKGEEK